MVLELCEGVSLAAVTLLFPWIPVCAGTMAGKKSLGMP